MEEQKQAKQQIQIDSNILNTLSKAVRVSKKKGNLDRYEYKKGINASKTEALFLLFENVLEEFAKSNTYEDVLSTASALLKGVNYTIKNIEELCPILSQSYANETTSIVLPSVYFLSLAEDCGFCIITYTLYLSINFYLAAFGIVASKTAGVAIYNYAAAFH